MDVNISRSGGKAMRVMEVKMGKEWHISVEEVSSILEGISDLYVSRDHSNYIYPLNQFPRYLLVFSSGIFETWIHTWGLC